MKEWKGRQKSHLLVFSFLLMAVSPQYLPAEWIEDASQNLPICTAAEDQHFPDLISDNYGGVIVAWRDVRNGNRDVFAQRISANGEMLWEGDGIPICVQPNAQSWPLLVPDAGEGAILVFGDSRHRNRDIYAQRIDTNGKLLWGEDGVPVSIVPFLKEDVKAISDGKGGAIVVWEDSRHGNLDIYAQRIDADGKPVWELNGVPVYKGEGDQYDPFLTTDDAGGAIIAWWDISTPDWNVFAQRMGATGEQVWEDGGVPVCTAPGNQGGPFVVADGSGGAFVVWSDYRNDPNIFSSADLYAQRIDANGKVLWEKDGINFCNEPSNQQQPEGISDGKGGLIVTWWDDRDIFADIYAQRIDTDGAPMWQDNGIPICVAAGVQREPHLVSDGSQGAIIYWKDFREDYGNVTADAIYAQRIDGSGKSIWTFNGAPVCTADGDQIAPRAIANGRGGAFIVWSDYRGKDADIYIHQIP